MEGGGYKLSKVKYMEEETRKTDHLLLFPLIFIDLFWLSFKDFIWLDVDNWLVI